MMEIGATFDVIYIDFAKAFDSVAQKCVNVEGTTSEWKEALYGIHRKAPF